MMSLPPSFAFLGVLCACLAVAQTNADCTCTEDAQTFEAFYQEFVDNNFRTVQTNGIPNHKYHIGVPSANPHNVCLQPSQVGLPVSPVFDDYKDAPMSVIGILKTGGFVYNHKSGTDGVDDVANHPSNEQPSLDICHGHADDKCTYHYHEISQLQECTHDGQWDTCELIGYILEGFLSTLTAFMPRRIVIFRAVTRSRTIPIRMAEETLLTTSMLQRRIVILMPPTDSISLEKVFLTLTAKKSLATRMLHPRHILTLCQSTLEAHGIG